MARHEHELARLQVALEAKEAAVASMNGHTVLREAYNERLRDLATERDALQLERLELVHKLASLQEASGGWGEGSAGVGRVPRGNEEGWCETRCPSFIPLPQRSSGCS